ncbi:hypothetical protein K504DRAFT_508990 [Pleomassaria siparia CBS 279.74]|uniref:Uncharacterized protein n=1 Tax=Pleomassaria siparia CBS 279.74 TaxID=1314801 RepID=A0A6G1JQH2_9PLEO|nr:hypothetical protein K504DRAFT_508990 [Pleomassaria siparia CBS 279.74]
MPPLPPSREDGDTGNQPLTQGISPSTISIPLKNASNPANQTPTWRLPSLPPLSAEQYTFETAHDGWRGRPVQSNMKDTVVISTTADLQILCWKLDDPFTLIPVLMTANPHRMDRSTGAGDIANWVPAFNVGSTHDNAISVTHLLLNILLLACPMADDDGAV